MMEYRQTFRGRGLPLFVLLTSHGDLGCCQDREVPRRRKQKLWVAARIQLMANNIIISEATSAPPQDQIR